MNAVYKDYGISQFSNVFECCGYFACFRHAAKAAYSSTWAEVVAELQRTAEAVDASALNEPRLRSVLPEPMPSVWK